MEKFYYENQPSGMSPEETKAALLASLEGRTLNKVLIIPPKIIAAIMRPVPADLLFEDTANLTSFINIPP